MTETERIPTVLREISAADTEDFNGVMTAAEKYLSGADANDNKWSEGLLRIFIDEPKRLAHSLMVGEGCSTVAKVINGKDGKIKVDEVLLCHAGTLHDIGQRKTTQGTTPWHELIGAVYARGLGLPKISRLIAAHATVPEGLTYFKQKTPEWVKTPQTLEEKILAVVDFLVLQGGKVVSLEERLADICQRFEGKPPAEITKLGEVRLHQMYEEIDNLTGGKLMETLKQVEGERLTEIKKRI